ncbi:MAG: heme biosynthesis protein HemY [Paracoccaceae bacterium]
MIGALIRLLAFAAAVVLVALGLETLLGLDGSVTVTLGRDEIVLTPIAAAAFLLVAILLGGVVVRAAGFLLATLRFVTGDGQAFAGYFEGIRQTRGIEALSQAMTALSAGDARTARVKSEKAERLLGRPELTRLVSAQAAELAGDRSRAREQYRLLAAQPATAAVGIRGLLGIAIAEGSTEPALRLAARAVELQPTDPELLDTLHRLSVEAEDWEGARDTVLRGRKVAAFAKDDADRREAEALHRLAEAAVGTGDRDRATQLAQDAAKRDPSRGDAVTLAAGLLIDAKQQRSASRLLIDAWRVNPSAPLAAAFADIEPNESPRSRQRRFARLIEANPRHAESRYLRAELALMAGDWAEARAAVEELGETEISARSAAIFAAVARGEGQGDAVVRGWLAKAVGASREEGEQRTLGQAAMLPLLISEDESPSLAGPTPDRAQLTGPSAARADGDEDDSPDGDGHRPGSPPKDG